MESTIGSGCEGPEVGKAGTLKAGLVTCCPSVASVQTAEWGPGLQGGRHRTCAWSCSPPSPGAPLSPASFTKGPSFSPSHQSSWKFQNSYSIQSPVCQSPPRAEVLNSALEPPWELVVFKKITDSRAPLPENRDIKAGCGLGAGGAQEPHVRQVESPRLEEALPCACHSRHRLPEV